MDVRDVARNGIVRAADDKTRQRSYGLAGLGKILPNGDSRIEYGNPRPADFVENFIVPIADEK